MDAIDGKQARRTGTGSPLGELFDHGLDCIANAFFLPSMLMCLQAGKDLDKFNMLRTDLKKLQFQNHRRKNSYAAYPMHRIFSIALIRNRNQFLMLFCILLFTLGPLCCW